MGELPTSTNMALKGLAMEIALLALLRQQRDNADLWDSIEKLVPVITSDLPLPEAERALAEDRVLFFLDAWRQIAGPDPRQPAPGGFAQGGEPPAR